MGMLETNSEESDLKQTRNLKHTKYWLQPPLEKKQSQGNMTVFKADMLDWVSI